jgi:hypothetical protein
MRSLACFAPTRTFTWSPNSSARALCIHCALAELGIMKFAIPIDADSRGRCREELNPPRR